MTKLNKYTQLENTENSWTLAKRWAKFGDISAKHLLELCVHASESERKLSNELCEIATRLLQGVAKKEHATIEEIGNKWESPSHADFDGLTTCYGIFSHNEDRLAAFHATLIGQMNAIGYVDREIALTIEGASNFKYMIEDLPDGLEELYEKGFGHEFEECMYSING